MSPEALGEVAQVCRAYLAELDDYCTPPSREIIATVLGELAIRYHEKQLSTEQMKILIRGYEADLRDIPAALWPEMGKRYRNAHGKSFFPQVWELRETVQGELNVIARNRDTAERLLQWAERK